MKASLYKVSASGRDHMLSLSTLGSSRASIEDKQRRHRASNDTKQLHDIEDAYSISRERRNKLKRGAPMSESDGEDG